MNTCNMLTAAELAVEVDDTEADEEPELELPEVAPVAAMRASRSAAVVQVMLVPAEFTNGSAAQLRWTPLNSEITIDRRDKYYSHEAASARSEGELAVHALGELAVDARVLARGAGRVGGETLELRANI